MDNNGRDPSPDTLFSPPAAAPQSTASMWGDVFGLGGFFKMISDPTLGQQAGQMMAAMIASAQATQRIEAKLDALTMEGRVITGMIASAQATQRIEAKLDALAKALAHEFDQQQRSAVSLEHGAAGNRGLAVAGGAADRGTGDAAQSDREPASQSRSSGGTTAGD